MEFGFWSLGVFRVQGSALGMSGMNYSLILRVQEYPGFRVQFSNQEVETSIGFRSIHCTIQGLGFRVQLLNQEGERTLPDVLNSHISNTLASPLASYVFCRKWRQSEPHNLHRNLTIHQGVDQSQGLVHGIERQGFEICL